jgi:hypothetical protein
LSVIEKISSIPLGMYYYGKKNNMKKYSHKFVGAYDGLMGFGWDRSSDESTVICYLQMFSDDDLMNVLIGRLTDDELNDIYQLLNRLLKTHLKDAEYHRLFLKDDHP